MPLEIAQSELELKLPQLFPVLREAPEWRPLAVGATPRPPLLSKVKRYAYLTEDV